MSKLGSLAYQVKNALNEALFPAHLATRTRSAAWPKFGSILTVCDLVIVAVLVDTGVWASELCRLCPCDINVDKKRTYILGKGDKERLVSLSTTVCEYIQAYLESGERSSGLTDGFGVSFAILTHNPGKPVARLCIGSRDVL